MKKISLKLFSFASAAALIVAGSGCAKISEFGNTNVNPNGATSPITAALLTNVESQLGGIAYNLRGAIYTQQISETQYTDVSLYQLPQLSSSGSYAGPMMDCQVIINQNSDPKTAGTASVSGSNGNQIGIAKILKAYIMWTLTDKWGDLPYSEALKGAANKSPKYDTQEEIYKAIFKDCRDGIASFDVGQWMKGDIVFGGDPAKWKKLANSIRMIASMRLSKRYPASTDYPALEFAAAFSHPAGYMSTNADNFILAFPGGNYPNTWWGIYNGRSDYAESKTLGDVLANLGDTRQAAFGTNAGLCFPYGLVRNDAVNFDQTVSAGNYSKVLAQVWRNENSPAFILTAAQSLLAAAEAREGGWITTGLAKDYYDAGVTASFAQWNVAIPGGYLTGAAAYNTGGGAPANVGANTYNSIKPGQNAATTNNVARIALQYWLASYPNGTEVWSNWRRTGVPNILGTNFATNSGGAIPRRYVYGTDEYALNPSQLATAIGRLAGGDTQDARVWWDKP